MVAGAVGAMALGVILIPLRAHTAASNLAFVFLAFTIIVAELGGRSAALGTALVSAMSLNFFLTEPYLTLAISKPDDIVAFVALAACGLIAAAFGKRRERLSEVASRGSKDLDILKKLSEQLRNATPLDDVLGDLRQSFGLGAIVLRDAGESVLAAAPRGSAPPSIPQKQLAPETFFPSDEARLRFGARGLRLPEGGGRLSLGTGPDSVSLDLWEGDPQGFTLDESRTLAVAASILGLELSRRQAGASHRPGPRAASGPPP
jgi:hypothetical protein